ncbi:helix-turn-helix domain-containing protein [Salipaludibacillus sp. LMS25]|uniref:helix-turn-helix domain-containing protein n=1 Tax=Salipaludibacillus sp. LMS25 TaxID=2924031 RepID=UPI0020D18C18|nr:helix-turn-helix transcriptional regulator [Salipaludibacillus sp. LMS25]UTR14311.1 helix-turn-helix domain-containing protein [Salipaludibacillus sp. LMS25]
MDNVLGKRLRLQREKYQLTQKKAAAIFGLTNFQLSRYESGQSNPDPDIIAKFAEYYDVSTDYLLGRTNIPTNESYDPLEDLKQYMIDNQLEDMDLGFYDIDQMKKLNRDQIQELKDHFDWVVAKAEKLEQKSKK